MSEVRNDNGKESIEVQIAALLEEQYGEGLMYPSRINNSRQIYLKAIDMGFIDNEGYLTRKGRSLITQYRFRH